MITHLSIIRPGENGSEQQTTHLITNKRELYKDIGSSWEIIGHLIEHLISMPGELTVNLTISGSESAVKTLNDCLGSLHSLNSFLRPMPSLTLCEIEVLDLLNTGMSEKQIADKKSVGTQSVRNMCCDMHKKFYCHTNGQMIASARRLRFVN